MDEGFDTGLDTGVDIGITDSDLAVDFEPLDDIAIEEPMVMDELEAPISEPELSELQNEAEALEMQPFDDGIDLGYDYDEAIQAANEAAEEQSYEPSALHNIMTAGAEGAEPDAWTQIGGEILAPPGAGEAAAQGLQMGTNAAVAGAEELMGAAIRQHGNPTADLQNMQIQQAIDAGAGLVGKATPLDELL